MSLVSFPSYRVSGLSAHWRKSASRSLARAAATANYVMCRRRVATSQGINPPADITATPDPFEVFAWAATISPRLAAGIEAAMTELEVEAVPTADPHPRRPRRRARRAPGSASTRPAWRTPGHTYPPR